VADDASDATRDSGQDIGRLVAQRLAGYIELWEGAATRLTGSTYRSEHLLDDWFRFCGMAARDMTAGAALVWGASRPAAGPDPSGQS
jgi:hypothetical protein